MSLDPLQALAIIVLLGAVKALRTRCADGTLDCCLVVLLEELHHDRHASRIFLF